MSRSGVEFRTYGACYTCLSEASSRLDAPYKPPFHNEGLNGPGHETFMGFLVKDSSSKQVIMTM